MLDTRPLSKRYRFKREELTPRVWLVHVPESGEDAWDFYIATHKIANALWNGGKPGASLNTVCTCQGGPILFQSTSKEKNLRRAMLVASLWRKFAIRRKSGKCTCRVATAVLSDENNERVSGTIFFSSVDDCPVHGSV